ncbi:hypothetical protein H311_03566, partial [Anncaliia algerae PRA109]
VDVIFGSCLFYNPEDCKIYTKIFVFLMHFEEQLNEILNMKIIQMFNKLVQDCFIQDTMICQACNVVMCLKPTGNKIDDIKW